MNKFEQSKQTVTIQKITHKIFLHYNVQLKQNVNNFVSAAIKMVKYMLQVNCVAWYVLYVI